MSRGFVLAITTAVIFIAMLLYIQSFYSSQSEDLDRIARALASEKVMHTWSDIKDDLALAVSLNIEKDEETLTINDTLPTLADLPNLLHLYGQFIEEHYKSPEMIVKFQSSTGELMDLAALPSVLRICPFNIEYYYPSWAKNELFITSSPENASAIEEIRMHIDITNAYMTCWPVDPGSSTPCLFLNPTSICTDKTVYPLHLNLSFSDYRGGYFNLPYSCFDLEKHSTENLQIANTTSNYYIKVLIGSLPNVLEVQLQNTVINTSTAIILNTSDFYINYMSKLYVSATDYNITKVDWI